MHALRIHTLLGVCRSLDVDVHLDDVMFDYCSVDVDEHLDEHVLRYWSLYVIIREGIIHTDRPIDDRTLREE